MKRAIGKIVGFAPFIPISFKIGLSVLPKRLNAARDCHTSTTHQPPGTGPAMCARQPFTGQSASRFLRPFKIFRTLFWYLERDAVPGNLKMTPMGITVPPCFSRPKIAPLQADRSYGRSAGFNNGFIPQHRPQHGVWINRHCARVRFSWLFIRTQVFDPQSSLRNVHVEALRIFPNHTLCGFPYTTRNNVENPHANCFG